MRSLIAILRGVSPSEVLNVSEILIEQGITQIEVPLNSPDPVKSIQMLVKEFSNVAVLGAGTVLDVEQVKAVFDTGAKLIVSPNCDVEVIKETKRLRMTSYPGVFTPTECFSALKSGADGLKFFPAMQLGSEGIKAVNAVLPANTPVFAVGGVDETNFASWYEAGATGFGIGSALYKPGKSLDEISSSALKLVEAYDALLAAE